MLHEPHGLQFEDLLKLLTCTYSYLQISHVFTPDKDSDVMLLIFAISVLLFGPIWLLVLLHQIEMLSIFERRILEC